MVVGFGHALFFSSNTNSIMSSVPREETRDNLRDARHSEVCDLVDRRRNSGRNRGIQHADGRLRGVQRWRLRGFRAIDLVGKIIFDVVAVIMLVYLVGKLMTPVAAERSNQPHREQ